MDEKSLKPQLRFKGFTDAWEQRKFKSTIQIERGGSPRPIEDYITNSENGLNWIKIGDAPSMGKYITKTAEKIKPEGLSKTREVHPGDLILSNSMSFGRPYIMAINGCIHDGWLLLRNDKNLYDLQFLCHLLGSENMLHQYKSFAAGSTVNNLNKDLVGNTTVSFPKKTEQSKLGVFFDSLDNLITLHQRKLDKLSNVKKALLEKMFPKNDSDVPEIRFKGFTDAWEQRKFQDMFSFERPDPYIVKSDKYSNEYTMPVLTANKAFVLGYTKENSPCKKTSLIFDDFTLECKYVDFPYMVKSSAIKILTVKDEKKDNLRFSFERLNTTKIEILGHARHYISVVQPTKTRTPNILEQNKISELFSNLDNLITLHQRKLEKLKNIKKACLEKMFV